MMFFRGLWKTSEPQTGKWQNWVGHFCECLENRVLRAPWGTSLEDSERSKDSNGNWASGHSCDISANNQLHSTYVLRIYLRWNSKEWANFCGRRNFRQHSMESVAWLFLINLMHVYIGKTKKWDKRNFKSCSLGEKRILKNLRFQPSHVLKSSSLFMSVLPLTGTLLCCIGTPGKVPWRQDSTRLEPNLWKERAWGVSYSKKQNLGRLLRGFTTYWVSSAGGTVWQCSWAFMR